MKVLVTGANGQLGYAVIDCLKKRNIEYIGAGREELDITNEEQTKAYITNYKPDAVIYCAAYTAVDKAEDEVEQCNLVNTLGARNVAIACRDIDCSMVYPSTDYVFPGTGSHEYHINDETGPLSVYGKSKLAGEIEVENTLKRYFIVRISWVFGPHGKNFVDTMLRIGKEKEEISVVADQIGSPTYTLDLASLLVDMIQTEKYGYYHATNEGTCSFAEFAEKIFQIAGYKTKVNHITSEEYPTKAIRPKNSRLSKESLDINGFDRLPLWEDALRRFYKNLCTN